MRAFVTGGGGFLGRALLSLVPGVVCAPLHDALDIRDEGAVSDALRAFQPTHILHLAALTDVGRAAEDPALAASINAEGAGLVARAARRAAPGARLLHVSTCHVYAPPTGAPIPETHPLAPRGSYARSKADGELRVRAEHPDAILVRPFNLLGPGQPPRHAVADWIRQAASGASTLRVGDLSLRRDYLDVRDGAEGLLVIAERGEPGGTYNLCRGEAVSMGWLAALAAPGLTPVADPARIREAEVPELVGDNARVRALGWAPRRALSESVEDLRRALRER